MTSDLDHDHDLRRRPSVKSRHIVVGVDGSSSSERALHYAVGLASRLDAGLVVVHVRRTLVAYSALGVVAALDEGALPDETRADIDRLSRECGLETTVIDLPGGTHAGTALARIADRYQADAVVVGASESRLHRVAGSIGAHLIKHARSPVTVVP